MSEVTATQGVRNPQPPMENLDNNPVQRPANGPRAQGANDQVNIMGNRVVTTRSEDQFSRAALTAVKEPINSGHEQLMRDAYNHVLGLSADSDAARNLDIAKASSDKDLNFIMHQDKFYEDEVASRAKFLIEKFPEQTGSLQELLAKANDKTIPPEESGAAFTDLKAIVDLMFKENDLPQVKEPVQALRDYIKSNNFFKKFGNDNVAIPRGRMGVSQLNDELQDTLKNQKSGGIGYNEGNPDYLPHDNRMGKQVNTVDPDLVTKKIFEELGIPFVGGASGSTIDFVGILVDQLLDFGLVSIDETGRLSFEQSPEGEAAKKDLEKKVFTFMMGMVECGHHSLSEMVYAAKQFGLFEKLEDPISSFMAIQETVLVAYTAKQAGEAGADELLNNILSNVVDHEHFISNLQKYAAKELDLVVDMTAAQQVEATGARI